MNGPSRCIDLEYQNALALSVVRVILDYLRGRNSRNNFPRHQSIRRKLVVSVLRDPHVADRNQLPDSVKCLTHASKVFVIIPAKILLRFGCQPE